MKSRTDDLWVVAATLLAVAIIFLALAGWMAGVLNLDLRSASFILVGALLAIAMVGCAIHFELSVRALAPWIVVLVAPSLVSALKYWASGGPGPFHFRTEEDMAWFGNSWWIFLMWLGLVGSAYLSNKLTDDWFMD
jgi:hypothetical protein